MAEVFCGVAASPGYALGPAFHYVPYEPSVSPSIIENRQSQENIGYYSAAREAAREELETLRRSQCVFYPQRDQAACDADYRQWRRAVERARSWIENDM